MGDPVTDAAIAQRWPREWAAANDPARTGNSKRRNKLRKQYAEALDLAALRKTGARCGNCEHFEARNVHVDHAVCELLSDFHGYTLADADGLCLKHARADAMLAQRDR